MKIFKIYIPLLILFSFFFVSSVKADSSSVSCSDLLNSVSNVLPKDVSGSIYIKLPKSASVDSSTLNIYTSPPTLGATCNRLANVQANKKTWVKLGDNLRLNQGDELTIDGQGLGAEVYAASAYILVVDDNACTPDDNCNISDSFGSGFLDPNIISTNTDQIAIYLATPIKGLTPIKYNYYDNGKLLYTSNSLKSFNRNYLSGGNHKIDIMAQYSNHENIHYISSIDMGQDWSKWLLIRSTFYKLKTPAKIIALVLVGIIILALVLLIYRLILNRIKAKHDHGVDNYTPENQPPIDPGSNIIVG